MPTGLGLFCASRRNFNLNREQNDKKLKHHFSIKMTFPTMTGQMISERNLCCNPE